MAASKVLLIYQATKGLIFNAGLEINCFWKKLATKSYFRMYKHLQNIGSNWTILQVGVHGLSCLKSVTLPFYILLSLSDPSLTHSNLWWTHTCKLLPQLDISLWRACCRLLSRNTVPCKVLLNAAQHTAYEHVGWGCSGAPCVYGLGCLWNCNWNWNFHYWTTLSSVGLCGRT